MKLLIHFQTTTVAPLTFRPTLLGLKVIYVSKRGPGRLLPQPGNHTLQHVWGYKKNVFQFWMLHYNDVIMVMMASQITSLTIVYSTVYSGADQRKHQSSASLAFVRGIHRWPVNSLHKWPATREMFPFDDVIMKVSNHHYFITQSHKNYGIKWKHLPRYWPFVRKALMFSLICTWTNGWANTRDAGDLGRHHAHYDVAVMWNTTVD